jgi:transposase-like protein
MPIKSEHLDELLSGYEKPEDLVGENGLFKQLKKALLERALGAELTHHLGYEKGDPAGRGDGNHRNGSYPKTVLTEDGAVDLDIPRDRNGSFKPQIVPKGETRLDGFDDKIISMYARGMTVRETARTLRRRCLARPHQPRDRCGPRRRARVAEPAARRGLSGEEGA